MNYRINEKNLKRADIKAIKRDEAEARNNAYQLLSHVEKIYKQIYCGKVHTKLMGAD